MKISSFSKKLIPTATLSVILIILVLHKILVSQMILPSPQLKMPTIWSCRCWSNIFTSTQYLEYLGSYRILQLLYRHQSWYMTTSYWYFGTKSSYYRIFTPYVWQILKVSFSLTRLYMSASLFSFSSQNLDKQNEVNTAGSLFSKKPWLPLNGVHQ